MWRGLLFTAFFVVGACAPKPVRAPTAEPLYLAVEVMQGGKRIGAPKLLGFAGHKVTAERRAPGSEDADYKLVMHPREAGVGYQLGLELTLPDGSHASDVSLLHGQERSVRMDKDTELRVLLMRVDSEEFRALISAKEIPQRGQI
jgi:hypothetical protein